MSSNVGSVGVELVALNASKVISDIQKYIQSLSAMEQATTKTANTINQSFTKLGQGGGGTSNLINSLKGVDTQMKATGSAVTQSTGQISQAFTKVGTDVNRSVQTSITSFNNLNTTTKQVVTGSQQMSTAFTKVGTDIDRSVKQSDTSLKTLNTTTKTVSDGSKQMGTAFQQAGQQISTGTQSATNSVKQLDTGFKQTNTTVEQFGNTTRTTVQRINEQGVATGKTVTEVVKLGTSTKEVTTTLDAQGKVLERNTKTLMDQGTAVDQTTSRWEKLGSASKTLFLGISTLTSGAFNLYNQWDSLNDASVQVERRFLKAKNSTDNAQKALRDYNAAVKEGKLSQAEINQLLDDYNDKQKAAEIATALATDAQDDLGRAWKDFWINVVPSGVQTIAGGVVTIKEFASVLKGGGQQAAETAGDVSDLSGSLADNATQASGAIAVGDKLKTAYDKVGGAAKTNAGKFAGLTTAITGVASAVGLGAGSFVAIVGAIAVAVGAIAGYATNFMGFRDAVNGAGKALGEWNPYLKIIGDGLVGVAGSLGLTGETAQQTKGHFIDMAMGIKTETDKMTTAYHNSLALMQQSNNVLVQDIANSVVNITASYTKMNDDFKNQLQLSGQTWNEFIGKLSSGDFEGAVDIIAKSLGAIPSILDTIIKDAGEFGKDLYNAIIGTLTDLGKEIGKWGTETGKALYGGLEAGVGLIDALIGRLVPGWGEIKQQVGEWVTNNIVTPLTEWYDQIKVPAGNLWNSIVGTATSIVDTVNSWVTTNIVEPLTAWWEDVLVDPNTLWTSIFGTATSLKTSVETWVKTNITDPILAFPDNIVIGATKIWEAIVGTATDFGSTVQDWLTRTIVNPILGLPDLIKDQAVKIIENILGFHSPLNQESITKVQEWNQAVALQFNGLWSTVKDQAGKIIDGILKGDVGANITKWVTGVWEDIKAQFDSLIKGAQETLKPITEPLSQGANNLATQFNQGVSDLGKWGASLSPQKPQDQNAPLTGKALDIDKVMNPEKYYGDTGQFQGTKINKPVAFTPQATPTKTGASQQVAQNYAEVLGLTQQAAAFTNRQNTGMDLVLGNLHKNQQQMATLNQLYTTVDQASVKAPQLQYKAGPGQDPFSPETRKAIGGMKSRFEGVDVTKGFQRGSADDIVKSTAAYTKLKEAVTNASNAQNEYGILLQSTAGKELLVQQGVLAREKAMQDMQTANLQAIGTNKEYADQIANQNLLGIAYESGLRKQEKALMDQQVASKEAEAVTAKLNEQMKTGIPQSLAFAKGIDEQKNALINLELGVFNTSAKLQELGTQLDDGRIKALAMVSGYQEAALAAKQMQVSNQELTGEITYLGESLTKTEDILARQNQGYLTAQKSALEWGMSLQESIGAQDGFREGLIQTANALVKDLPAAFEGTNEDFQNFISLSLRAGDAFDSFIEGVQSAAEGTLSSLGDALTKSNKDFEEGIDKLEEDWGVKFDNGIRNVFETNAGVESIGSTVSHMMEALAMGKDQITNPEFFNSVRSTFVEKFAETWDDIEEETTPEIDAMFQTLMNTLNQPVPMTKEGITGWMADVQIQLEALKNKGAITSEEFSTSIGAMNKANLATVTENLKAMGIQVTGVDTATGYFTTSTSGLVDATGRLIDPLTGAASATGTLTGNFNSATTAANSFAASLAATQKNIADYNQATGGLFKNAQATGNIFQTESAKDNTALGGGSSTSNDQQAQGATGDATQQLAAIMAQIAQIPVAMNAAFSQGVANAQGSFGILLASITETFIPTFTEQMTAVSVVMNEQFTQSIANAQGSFGIFLASIVETFIPTFTEQMTQVSVVMNDTFSQAVANAQGSFGIFLASIVDTFIPTFTEQMTQVAVIMNDSFKTGTDDAAGYMNALASHVATKVSEMEGSIEDVAVALNDNFKRGADDAAGYLNALGTIAFNVMRDIVDSTDAARQAMSNLGEETNQVSGLMEQLGQRIDEISNMVQDLGQQLDALPDVERTIHYSVEVDPLPAQTGFAGGVGIGMGTAARSRAIVGENGRELVMMQPIARMERGGSKQSFITNHMQEIDFTGKELTVIPLERRNSENFLKKFPMFRGLVNRVRKIHGIPRFEFGISPGADPNTAAGPITTSSDGKVHTWEDGDTPYVVRDWNKISDDGRIFLAESDDVGIKSLPDRSYLHEDYSIGLNDPLGNSYKNGYINNTTWRQGPNAGEPSPYYDSNGNYIPGGGSGTGGNGNGGTGNPGGGGNQGGGDVTNPQVNGDPNSLEMGNYTGGTYKTVTGYTVPNYIQSPGHGATDPTKWTNPNMDPRSWRSVQMTSDPTKWKVIDNKGVNIAAGFVEEDQADEFIAEHIIAAGYGPSTGGTGGSGGVPPGTNTGGGGGSGGVPGGTNTGYTPPSYVQTSGGSKWSTSPGDPNSWTVVPMTDASHKGEFKIVDSSGMNVAANFKSQQEANDYLAWKKGNTTGGTGGGTGGTGGTPAQTYTVPSQVLLSDPNNSNPEVTWASQSEIGDPETWKVARMVEVYQPTGQRRWKVVNKDGKNIASRFDTQADAQAYIDAHIEAKGSGTYTSPTAGGGTLTTKPAVPGTGTGTGTGGTGTGTGGTGGGSGTGTGTGTSGGGNVGQTIPGYNGNFNYQINGRQLQITQGKIVKNTLTAEDWVQADAAFFKATGLHLPPYSSGSGTGGTGTGGGQGTGTTTTGPIGDSEGSKPGWGGETYKPSNMSYNFAPGVVWGGGGGSSPSTGGGGFNFPGTGTGGGTNIGGINFPPGFPFENTPKGPGGGPIIGGIEFPPNFPFNDTGTPNFAGVPSGTSTGTGTQTNTGQNLQYTDANGNMFNSQNDVNTESNFAGWGGTGYGTVPTTTTGNGGVSVIGTTGGNTTSTPQGGVQQSQVVSQNSIVNQGNNSNFDTMSGTNSRLRIQNGVVVEATGIYSGYKVGDPVPGSGGIGGGSGQVPTGSGISASLAALMQKPQDIPRAISNFYDSMGTTLGIGNERDPLYREFGFNRILDTGGVGGNNPNTPGSGGGKGFDTLNKLVTQLTEFVRMLLGKTLDTKSIWTNMSNITSSNIGTLP